MCRVRAANVWRPRPSKQPDTLPWEPTRPQDKPHFWERTEAPSPPLRPRCNLIHPRQFSTFPERLKLPFPSDEVLSSYEDIVSSRTHQFTAWVKMDPHEVLVHRMVHVQEIYRRLSRGLKEEACYIFSNKPSQQTLFCSVTCAEAAQHLQLQTWAPTRKRRCLRKGDCKQVACHYLAGGIRACRT